MMKKLLAIKSNQIMAIVSAALLILSIVAICLFYAIFLPAKRDAKTTAGIAGEALGNAVGVAVGSFEGITSGVPKGTQDGIEAGLSAEDTQLTIHENVKEIGKLEVLQASVSLVNQHSIGNTLSQLNIMYADAVFTVDLTKAVIKETNQEILITLPSPEFTMSIDETKTEQLAEYERMILNGDAETAYIADMNTMKEIAENAEQYIHNYDVLMKQARNSALNNVKMLIEQVSVNQKNVTVQFAEESGVS